MSASTPMSKGMNGTLKGARPPKQRATPYFSTHLLLLYGGRSRSLALALSLRSHSRSRSLALALSLTLTEIKPCFKPRFKALYFLGTFKA